MKMNEFILMAESKLEKAFPDYVVRLFPDPDDDATFFAYVFCVPDGAEKDAWYAVRAEIRERLEDKYDWEVLPSIKNLSTTKGYYPQYLKRTSHEGSPTNEAVLETLKASPKKPADRLDCIESAFDLSDCKISTNDGLLSGLKNDDSQFKFAA